MIPKKPAPDLIRDGNRFSERSCSTKQRAAGKSRGALLVFPRLQVIVDSRFGMSDDDPRPGFGKIIPTRSR